MYAETTPPTSSPPPSTAPKVSLEELKSRAEKRDAQAQCDIGEIYYEGKGVKQDYQEAFNWFKKAADQGYPEAIEALKKIPKINI